MRHKYTVVVLLIAIVAAPAIPLTGQEEPLPPIQVKLTYEPAVVLAVVPFHEPVQPTLADAVRANDFATFDALYRSAPMPAFAMLHELWTFSMNDPVGAFFGPELRDRIARAYPGFAEYIEEFRIIDSNGNAFYPTSETRAFLLDRAIEGRAPRVLLAETVTSTPRIGTPASSPAERAASRRRAPVVAAKPKPIPTRVAARDAAGSAGEDAGVPQAVALAAPVVAETAPAVVAEQTPAPAPAPVVAAPVVPAVVQQPNDFGSRGILLLVIGLIGIGILAMMLRAPRDEPPVTILPAQPITRPSAAPPPPPAPQESGKNRATGSHG
ncbi:MAG TPA: hypothetical protein VEK79_16050 [Thermoanaerobaculia bacterium]|nr:hypothetical protein [Thermoanaerobaculia bacterium]